MAANPQNSPLEFSTAKATTWSEAMEVTLHGRELVTDPEEQRALAASLEDHLTAIALQEPLTILGTINRSQEVGLTSVAQAAAWRSEIVTVEAPDFSSIEQSPLPAGKRL